MFYKFDCSSLLVGVLLSFIRVDLQKPSTPDLEIQQIHLEMQQVDLHIQQIDPENHFHLLK